MDLFKCPSTERCPGGRPGECAPGLQGAAAEAEAEAVSPKTTTPSCAECMEKTWNMYYICHIYKSMVKMVVISILNTYRAFGHDLLAVFS